MYSRHSHCIAEFNKCIEEEDFYNAHEKLEELWFKRRFEDDDEIKLLKGFINATVSFELIKRGREKPSKKAWATYIKYRPLLYKVSSPYLNEYHQISRKLEKLKEIYTLLSSPKTH